MGKDVIVACDFASAEATFAFLDKFTEEKPFVKIGMELYYAEGPSIVRELKKRGHKIFLDLKLHDIPNTVKKSMAVLSRLDVDMTNVHAAGTVEMMEAALEGLTRPDGTRPLLIAVTQLTSTSEERMQKELLINANINDTIVQYAKNAKTAGLDGVVCSPLEAGMVKVYLPSPLSVSLIRSPFLSVTVSLSSSYPSSGFTVMVTVVPLEARVGLTFTLPLSVSSTLTVYRVELEEEPPEELFFENVAWTVQSFVTF